MSKAIERIKENAENLAQVRKQIREVEDGVEKALVDLKLKRDDLQLALLTELKKEGLSSIKTEDKDTYSIGTRKGVGIKSEAHALKWAIDNMAISIDKKLVAQKLKDIAEIPDCFEVVETEFISIRSPKVEKEKIEIKENGN